MPARSGDPLNMPAVTATEQVALVPPGSWGLDAGRSTMGFEVRHLKLMHVRGRFHEVAADISRDEHAVVSIDGSVSAASIDTGDARRDARLRAEDFFDVEHHPTISFTGVSSPVAAGSAFTVRGTLTIRGVSRPLVLGAEPSRAPDDGDGDWRIRAYGVVSRRDFGLDWDPAFAAGGLVIDDRIVLRLDAVLSSE